MIPLLKGPTYLLYRRRIANMTDDELEIELGERLQRTHSWPDDDKQWKRDCSSPLKALQMLLLRTWAVS